MKVYGDLTDEYSQKDNSKVVILPVPYDGTSTWGKGADKGCAAIIEASANMELYDIETDTEVYKKGIYTADSVNESRSPELMTEAVYSEVKNYLDKGKLVVTVGGEHSVSVGSIKAYSEKYDQLHVLQLDAHSDMRDEYNGSRYNHACAMARAKEYATVVQAGIRSMDISEKGNIDYSRIFFADIIRKDQLWLQKVAGILKNKNVYLTIDLDVFDPSELPSTGTPEPGGLGWYEVLDLIRTVSENSSIVGFDVVELCPDKNAPASDFLAAKLIYKTLSYIFKK